MRLLHKAAAAIQKPWFISFQVECEYREATHGAAVYNNMRREFLLFAAQTPDHSTGP
ncbi:hypothetical protein PS3A_58720 [Pseudomonas sp. 3A(2025)]